MLERGLQYFKNWFHNDDNKKCYDTYREEIDQYNIRILNFFNALVLLLLVIVFFSGFFYEICCAYAECVHRYYGRYAA